MITENFIGLIEMRKIHCLWLVLMILLPAELPAQQAAESNTISVVTDEIMLEKRRLIEERIDFTEAEKEKFWPLYGEFETRMNEVVQNTSQQMLTLQRADMLTDAEAETLIDQMMINQKEAIEIQELYAKKFREVLPAKKIAVFVGTMLTP